MSQLVDNHSMGADFPELKDTIHELKMNDAHFARLSAEYELLDKEIVRAEQQVEIKSDEELEELKMKRVHLKDTLYKILREKQ